VQHCCKNFSYYFDLQRVIRQNKRKVARQKRQESYVNPINKALEFARIMKAENLNRSQLARKMGISKVRVCQILKVLELPEDKVEYILRNGKKEIIT
jgi:ParB-like chromosome segregation protein Spo0J